MLSVQTYLLRRYQRTSRGNEKIIQKTFSSTKKESIYPPFLQNKIVIQCFLHE